MAVSAKLWVYVTGFSAPVQIQLYTGSPSNNWGSSLTADATDFNSTDAHAEQIRTINATGWWSFTIDPDNLDLFGLNYFRLRAVNENQTSTKQVIFSSHDSATNKPYIEITGFKNLYPFWFFS